MLNILLYAKLAIIILVILNFILIDLLIDIKVNSYLIYKNNFNQKL
jgi:hypothetical protein